MKKVILFAVITCLSASTTTASLFPSDAIQEAERFVSLIDNQEYQTAYQATSNLLRLTTTEDEWIDNREVSAALLGEVLERELVSVKERDHYPGLPDGDYLIVYFEARTELKKAAAEVLLLTKDVHQWAICKYRLK